MTGEELRSRKTSENKSVSALSEFSSGNTPLKSKRPFRDVALDFSKGMLVLLMVIYHWLNYFISVQGFGYRYIRFITPSFVFLAGFVITNVLAPRSDGKSLYARRLFMRGVKLLTFFTVLNLGVAWLAPVRHSGRLSMAAAFLNVFPATYMTGENASFSVLMPISYTLMLAALLRKASSLACLSYLTSTVLLFGVGFGLTLSGVRPPVLELVNAGLFGLIIGSLLTGRLHFVRRFWPLLAIAYIIHLAAITVWGVPLALQLISVCLNLSLFYCLAYWMKATSATARVTQLLGQYSLLGYVGQIAILQVLFIVLRLVDIGSAAPVIALAAAFLFTVCTIVLTDLCRRKSRLFDSLYRFVFV